MLSQGGRSFDGSGVSASNHRGTDAGFTLVELLAVVLVIGVLVLIAIPVYVSARAVAEKRTCIHNQQILSRAAEIYLGADVTHQRSDLVGPVSSSHPVVVENILGRPPYCVSGDDPVDRDNPTASEGGYRFDAQGGVLPCPLGGLGAHGSYKD